MWYSPTASPSSARAASGSRTSNSSRNAGAQLGAQRRDRLPHHLLGHAREKARVPRLVALLRAKARRGLGRGRRRERQEVLGDAGLPHAEPGDQLPQRRVGHLRPRGRVRVQVDRLRVPSQPAREPQEVLIARDHYESSGEKSPLRAPHTGQDQFAGMSEKSTPGAIPPSASPSAGSYTYPQSSQTHRPP